MPRPAPRTICAVLVLACAAAQAEPADVDELVALARKHLTRNDYEKAIPLAQRAVEAEPRSSAAHLILAQALGTKAQSIAKVRAAFLADDIKEHFEQAVECDPRNVEARSGLTQFHLQAPRAFGGDLAQARQQAEAIAELDPPLGLELLVQVFDQMKNEAEALAALERLTRVDAGRGHLARARRHLGRKEPDAAARELLRVAEEEPPDAEDLVAAAVQLQFLERWAEALTLLGRAQAADPSDLLALYQTGRACLLSGTDLPRAEASFRRYLAVESAPNRSAAYWRLGMVHEKMGRPAEARSEFQEALRLDPKNEEARRSLAALD